MPGISMCLQYILITFIVVPEEKTKTQLKSPWEPLRLYSHLHAHPETLFMTGMFIFRSHSLYLGILLFAKVFHGNTNWARVRVKYITVVLPLHSILLAFELPDSVRAWVGLI